jgi:allantoinase
VAITRRPKRGAGQSERARAARARYFEMKVSVPEFEAMLKRQFDTLYREGETVPRVMAIAVHPFVTGQPHRIGALDAALEYICSHPGVWRATGWEIVQHYLSQQV